MRRALLAAAVLGALAAACRPPAPPVVVRTGLPTTEPTVRVGIVVDSPEVQVSAAGPYEVVLQGGTVLTEATARDVWSFTADDAGRLIGRGPGGHRLGPYASPVLVRVRDAGRSVLIAGQPYRGGALIRAAGPGRVTAVNVLALEEYLLGVVPLEIGYRPAAEIEAVKAQAIAARTYAVSHVGSREALGFDFFATVADQVYGGIGREDSIAARAVRETRGEILMYDGAPILAYYHSTCGGRTAAVDEVWSHAPLPYLKSVSDRVEEGGEGYYCEISNRFRWNVSWTAEALRSALSRALSTRSGRPVEVRRVERVEVTGRTPSGRAESLLVVADGESHRIEGDSIRRVLLQPGGEMLNSTLFVLDAETSGGEVRSLEANGGGWGHGVGMCQMGAIGRARAGQSYRKILTTYYPGAEIVKLY